MAFEKKKSPPTGISRGNACDEIWCFQVRATSSRHLIYIHVCVQFGLFVDRWWLKEVWYAPDFLSNYGTCTLAAPGITRGPSKRICRGTLSQKTRNWPIWQAADGYVTNEGPILLTSLLWKLACTFNLRTNVCSSVLCLHFSLYS